MRVRIDAVSVTQSFMQLLLILGDVFRSFTMQIKSIINSAILFCLLFFSFSLAQSDAEQQATLSLHEARNIVNMLSAGGYTVYVRHTHTDHSRQDSDPTDCNLQRLLSGQGIQDASNIGRIFSSSLRFPIDRLISTEYCRTKDTARLAFGNAFGTGNEVEIIKREDLFTELATLLGTPPAQGNNNFIVAHTGVLKTATGLRLGVDVQFEEGDALVFKPVYGGSYELVASIGLDDWPRLSEAKLGY